MTLEMLVCACKRQILHQLGRNQKGYDLNAAELKRADRGQAAAQWCCIRERRDRLPALFAASFGHKKGYPTHCDRRDDSWDQMRLRNRSKINLAGPFAEIQV